MRKKIIEDIGAVILMLAMIVSILSFGSIISECSSKPNAKAKTVQLNTKKNVTKKKWKKVKYMGRYELTAYCNCKKCCGQWAGGRTASGTIPKQGRTVACNSIPFKTKLLIKGKVYTVEDTGGMANNVIDIYFNSHAAALRFGRRQSKVYKLKKKKRK
jgi:3D (Asp-Asp-Asp) domain-containing protein